MNITLDGAKSDIKRKISVNGNLSIDKFCIGVIRSMRGDLSHGYGLKRGKEFLYDIFNKKDLSWGEYDINDFNVDEINKIFEKNIRKVST